MLTVQQAKEIYYLADWYYGGHVYYEVVQIIERVIECGIYDLRLQVELAEDDERRHCE